eukprot:3502646-Rhodomonas_salina.1
MRLLSWAVLTRAASMLSRAHEGCIDAVTSCTRPASSTSSRWDAAALTRGVRGGSLLLNEFDTTAERSVRHDLTLAVQAQA